MEEKLLILEKEAQEALAHAKNARELENIRVKYLGKKGMLTELLRSMGSLPKEERPHMGQVANKVRLQVEKAMNEAGVRIGRLEMEAQIAEETIDISIPGKIFQQGSRHPLTQALDELKEVFIGMGFTVVEGPEV